MSTVLREDEARVSMIWPKDIKERVRTVSGARGMTEFVLEAVEYHLKRHDQSTGAVPPAALTPENPMSRTEIVHPTARPSEVLVAPPADMVSDASPLPRPESVPERKTNDLFAKVMKKTSGSMLDELEGLRGKLQPASELPKPPKKEPTPDGICPTCGEPLVGDECWSCA